MEKQGLKEGEKVYLGDAVYAERTRFGFTLTTENGLGATNTIHIEDNVVRELKEFIKRIELL
jgi:hypothetical protein